jgi:hypothetical protein
MLGLAAQLAVAASHIKGSGRSVRALSHSGCTSGWQSCWARLLLARVGLLGVIHLEDSYKNQIWRLCRAASQISTGTRFLSERLCGDCLQGVSACTPQRSRPVRLSHQQTLQVQKLTAAKLRDWNQFNWKSVHMRL